MLAPLPSSLFDDHGRPIVGQFAGPLPEVRLGRRAWLRHKRWHYALVATEEVICAAAIVDAGYAANAFAAVIAQEGLVADASTLSIPGLLARVGDLPEEGCDAACRGPGLRVSLSRAPGETAYRLHVRGADFQIDARLDTSGAPPPLVAVAAPPGGVINVTQKRALLPVTGLVTTRQRVFALDGGLGGLDYTQGLLPHHTTWRWAYACGRAGEQGPVALNLVQGFNGAVECAAWVRRGAGWEIVPLEEARIEYQAVDRPWQVNTPDGAVDLTFTPTGCHREHRDLGLVRSRFVQAAGHFSGRLTLPGGPAVPFDRVPGVTEDQDLRW